MTHRITEFKKAQQRLRTNFVGEPFLRPIFTGTARRGYTPSDLESLESVVIPGEAADGSALPLEGYDDIPSYP